MGACQSVSHDPATDVSGNLEEFKRELAVSTHSCSNNVSTDFSAESCSKSKRHSKNKRSLNASSHTATTGTSEQSLNTKDSMAAGESIVPVEIKKEKRKSKRRSDKNGSSLKDTVAAVVQEIDSSDHRSHSERSKSFATHITSSRKSGSRPVFIPNDSSMNLMLEERDSRLQ